ncbi:MAG TPA: cation:proton antiporter [Pyrinomonadaceae bacterium]|nr:cation:proton antiporter [Pyrinomonadaceae bacterium]
MRFSYRATANTFAASARGLALSFAPQFSHITIDPELVFFIFLPLYEAAWQVSWKEFWRWRRVISGFAFPIVIFTSCVVALISSALIPVFTLALAFLLGGIVSPPDAVSRDDHYA